MSPRRHNTVESGSVLFALSHYAAVDVQNAVSPTSSFHLAQDEKALVIIPRRIPAKSLQDCDQAICHETRGFNR
jgi:hypothetical protein